VQILVQNKGIHQHAKEKRHEGGGWRDERYIYHFRFF